MKLTSAMIRILIGAIVFSIIIIAVLLGSDSDYSHSLKRSDKWVFQPLANGKNNYKTLGNSGNFYQPRMQQAPQMQQQQQQQAPRMQQQMVHEGHMAMKKRASTGISYTSVEMDSISFTNAESKLGFSTGGAKDVNTFRDNINNNYVPLPSSISMEGLFYEYYFDTSSPVQNAVCNKLFCPSYALAQAKDPFSDDSAYDTYITVGLRSGIDSSSFHRKKLNLVVALDISGSMGEIMQNYYYDRFSRQGTPNTASNKEIPVTTTKMEVAKKSLISLLGHLKDDDRIGIVLFESTSYLALPLSSLSSLDIDALKGHISELHTMGGTNMEAGFNQGLSLFDVLNDELEYDNRIIFITDAQPNTGIHDENGLYQIAKDAAMNEKRRVYSTFIGVGVDFGSDLIKAISNIEGSNYYSVNTNEEFSKRMDEEFEYMVTPLVFDLRLRLTSDYWEIAQVYGSPQAEKTNGELMNVATLFPSPTNEEGETKGGIVLLRLTKKKEAVASSVSVINGAGLTLTASYKDGNRKEFIDKVNVNVITNPHNEIYENNGIRKGVVLTRYATILRLWMMDAYGNKKPDQQQDQQHHQQLEPYQQLWKVGKEQIPILPDRTGPSGPATILNFQIKGEWERQSLEIRWTNVEGYVEVFEWLKDYITNEAKLLDDKDLLKEVELLDKLIKYDPKIRVINKFRNG